jgi:hypothetical protein
MFLATALNAQTVLYDNLGASNDAYYSVAGSGPLSNSFSTGATSVVLSDLKLFLDLGDEGSGGVTVTLSSDSNNTPGAQIRVLGTIQDTSVVSEGAAVDLPVNPGVTLSPNTRYWITLSSNQQTSIQWVATDSTSVKQLPTKRPASPTAHGQPLSLGCFSNSVAVDPFLMQVNASQVSVPVSAPDLSFTGMTLLTLLLAASAAVFLRRSYSIES